MTATIFQFDSVAAFYGVMRDRTEEADIPLAHKIAVLELIKAELVNNANREILGE